MNNITLIYNIYKFYNYSTYVYTGYQIFYYGNKTYIYLFPPKTCSTPLQIGYLENISDNWIICTKNENNIPDDYEIIEVNSLL